MEICNFKEHSDNRGRLIAWENYKNIPFEIKRVYCIYGIKGKDRGYHAHKEGKSVLVCLNGSCNIVLDDGKKETIFRLDDPCEGLFIGNQTWIQMRDFADGTVLLALADNFYDEDNYIEDYNDFIEGLKNI